MSADGVLRVVRECGATVVSFDLFDTLVYRAVAEPEDIFREQFCVAPALQAHLESAEQWVRLRKSAEHRLAAAAAPGEISLEAIYRELGPCLNLSTAALDALRARELELEHDLLMVYPHVGALIGALRQDGCTIVITTDTYLPEHFVRATLERLLHDDYDELYCSSATSRPKRHGGAWATLLQRFATQSLVHFGDNLAVDQKMARAHGVRGFQVRWSRQSWLVKNAERLRYLKACGIHALTTPEDATLTKTPRRRARDELAWRWSVTLADFLLEARACAQATGVTDLWFVSRDCEAMYKAVKQVPEWFGHPRVQYVVCSRASCYPIIADQDPQRFQRWTGRLPNAIDREDGAAAGRYYRALLTPKSRHVLVVDVGWKGRLQFILRSILPESVRVSGYYFSLEPDAESVSVRNSRCFARWDRSAIHQASIECLSGFNEDSCEQFREAADGQIAPVYRPNPRDRAPADYCRSLQRYLVFWLRHQRHGLADPRARPALRLAAITSACAFPDAVAAVCFRGWSIGTAPDGRDAKKMIQPAWHGRLTALRSAWFGGALWPAGQLWAVTRRPSLVRLLQHLIFAQSALRAALTYSRHPRSPNPPPMQTAAAPTGGPSQT